MNCDPGQGVQAQINYIYTYITQTNTETLRDQYPSMIVTYQYRQQFEAGTANGKHKQRALHHTPSWSANTAYNH